MPSHEASPRGDKKSCNERGRGRPAHRHRIEKRGFRLQGVSLPHCARFTATACASERAMALLKMAEGRALLSGKGVSVSSTRMANAGRRRAGVRPPSEVRARLERRARVRTVGTPRAPGRAALPPRGLALGAADLPRESKGMVDKPWGHTLAVDGTRSTHRPARRGATSYTEPAAADESAANARCVALSAHSESPPHSSNTATLPPSLPPSSSSSARL